MATAPQPAATGPDPLALLRSLPCVSSTLGLITTIGIGPVTRLLESAAYLPLFLSREEAAGHSGRRFSISTRDGPDGSVRAVNGAGAVVARSRHLLVHPIADDAAPGPRAPAPPVPLDPRRSQRIQVSRARVEFPGAGNTAYEAFGTGRTYPGPATSGGAEGRVPFAAPLDLVSAEGQLAGLAGTVLLSGTLSRRGLEEALSLARIVDPQGGLLTACPLPPAAAGKTGTSPAGREEPPGGEGGATYLSFLGEVDPQHPVTLRISLTEGFLGSNVFELLRPASLSMGLEGGCLLSHTTTGGLAGAVAARLSFDPLTLCPLSGVQTRQGVFTFHDCAGREVGTIAADMVDGRAFRTFVGGRLLPFFRFGGSGPVGPSTGIFAGARGIMMLNAIISVQPRTLSNLYVFRLEDPHGRYRARLEEVWS